MICIIFQLDSLHFILYLSLYNDFWRLNEAFSVERLMHTPF